MVLGDALFVYREKLAGTRQESEQGIVIRVARASNANSSNVMYDEITKGHETASVVGKRYNKKTKTWILSDSTGFTKVQNRMLMVEYYFWQQLAIG